jgi:hypothetical protein
VITVYVTIAQNRTNILQFPALKGLISDVFMAFLMRNMPLCEKSGVQKIAIDFQKRGVSKRKIDYFETKTNKTSYQSNNLPLSANKRALLKNNLPLS